MPTSQLLAEKTHSVIRVFLLNKGKENMYVVRTDAVKNSREIKQ
jgi:hypothetical protein